MPRRNAPRPTGGPVTGHRQAGRPGYSSSSSSSSSKGKASSISAAYISGSKSCLAFVVEGHLDDQRPRPFRHAVGLDEVNVMDFKAVGIRLREM